MLSGSSLSTVSYYSELGSSKLLTCNTQTSYPYSSLGKVQDYKQIKKNGAVSWFEDYFSIYDPNYDFVALYRTVTNQNYSLR